MVVVVVVVEVVGVAIVVIVVVVMVVVNVVVVAIVVIIVRWSAVGCCIVVLVVEISSKDVSVTMVIQVALTAYQIRHMHSTAMASRLSIVSILSQVSTTYGIDTYL